MSGQDRNALEHWTARRGQPKDARQLGNEDVHRNAREKTDRHRYREKIRNPAQTENSGCKEQKSDHERESCSQQRVFWRAGRSEENKTSGKDRRYSRISSAREKAVASKDSKRQ